MARLGWGSGGVALVLMSFACAPKPPVSTPAASGDDIEAWSLLGRSLRRPAVPPDRKATLEAALDSARAAWRRRPDDVESWIWLGRRTAYLGRFRESISIYTRVLLRWPDEPRLYRHRGHRYITVRDFDAAIADLEKAAVLVRGVPDALEPDGSPNRYDIPTSTHHGNIWYHLGLAHYLKHDFTPARRAFHECLQAATTDDMRVATADWLYMTCRRLGRTAEAESLLVPIHRGMRILENEAYFRRVLLYKGELAPDSLLGKDGDDIDVATHGYGVANWYAYNGQADRAAVLLRRVLETPAWHAFGYIAAEADAARLAPEPGAR